MSDMNVDGYNFSRREAASFLFRYWRRIAIAFILPLLVSILAASRMEPLYTSTSVLIVRMGPEYIYQPEANLSPVATQQAVPLSQQQIFKSELAILDSYDLLRDVVQKIGVQQLYPKLMQPSLFQLLNNDGDVATSALSAAIELFNKSYDVQLQKDSAVITVTYKHTDPAIAQRALSQLLDTYMVLRHNLYARGHTDVAKNAVNSAMLRMQQADAAVAAAKSRHAVYSIEAEQASLLQARADLERRRNGINSEAFESGREEIDEKLGALRDAQHQLSAFENAAKVARDEYAILLNRYDQAKLQADLEQQKISSVRIIQTPSVSGAPKSKRLMTYVLGLIASVLASIAVAIITDYRRTTFSSPEDVRRILGLKVLASLPLRQ